MTDQTQTPPPPPSSPQDLERVLRAVATDAATTAKVETFQVLARELRLAGYEHGRQDGRDSMAPLVKRSDARAAKLAEDLARAEELAGDVGRRVADAFAESEIVARAHRFRCEQLEIERERARVAALWISAMEWETSSPTTALRGMLAWLLGAARAALLSEDFLKSSNEGDVRRLWEWLSDPSTGDASPLEQLLADEYREGEAATFATARNIVDDTPDHLLGSVGDALGCAFRAPLSGEEEFASYRSALRLWCKARFVSPARLAAGDSEVGS